MSDNNKETRTVTFDRLEVRKNDDGEPTTIHGHAAVFNRDSEVLGFGGFEFVERIEPGAFKRALEESQDVVALFNHDSNRVLGRTPDTLRMEEDKTGLAVEIDLPDTPTAREVATLIERRDIRGMSFAFRARKEEWEDVEDGPDIRTIKDADLFDVSAVTRPAYPDTKVAVRMHEAFRESLKPKGPTDEEVRLRQEQEQAQATIGL